MRRTTRRLSPVLLAFLIGAVSADARRFDVNALDDAVDAVPGDGVCADARGLCTLRAAVQETNALPGPDEIVLGPGVHVLSIVGLDEDAAATGDLDLFDELTLRGAGPDRSFFEVDPTWEDRLLHQLRDMPPLTIQDLTVRGSEAASREGGVFAQGEGLTLRNSAFEGHAAGAVVSWGATLVEDCLFRGNSGGVSALLAGPGTARRTSFLDNLDGSITAQVGTVEDCHFEGNRVNSQMLIATSVYRTVMQANEVDANGYTCTARTVEDCQIVGNTGPAVWLIGEFSRVMRRTAVRDNGGQGVFLESPSNVLIDSCTISGNRSTHGGGIETHLDAGRDPSLTLVNSTISGNIATEKGGGLYIQSAGGLRIFSSTIVGNSCPGCEGGGIHAESEGADRIENTIISGNTAATGQDCFGTLPSSGHVLLGDATDCSYMPGPGDLLGLDPMLGPLENNGGPTATMALLDGSPAIDGAAAGGCLGPDGLALALDQRGALRQVDGDSDGIARCDIGAYEYGVDVAVEGLVERTVVLGSPGGPDRIAEAFAATCRETPWRPCPEYRWPGPFDGMTLPNVVRRYAQPRVTFYEHSDTAMNARVALVAGDLVFSLP